MCIKSKIRKYLSRRLEVPEIPLALERLANSGFQPSQIFDIGAYKGEFAQSCLNIWPDTKIICFEALQDKVIQLKHLAESNSAIKVLPVLLGAEAREKVALHQAETASSVLVEQIEQNFPVNFYSMKTVDSVIEQYCDNRSPDLLKIDVQGFDTPTAKSTWDS